ncbi:MAG: EAL domain-containing protein [Nitrospirae bacterium]|nr:MAG: EAL domain-containing protein [Nitrospirota bacterium]
MPDKTKKDIKPLRKNTTPSGYENLKKTELLGLVSQLRRRLKAAEKSENLHKSEIRAVRLAGIAYTIMDADQRITALNKTLLDLTGLTEKEALGKNLFDCLLNANDNQAIQKIKDALLGNENWQGEILCRKKGRKTFPAWLIIAKFEDEKDKIQKYTTAFWDITRFKNNEKMLQEMAHFDVLTKLPNRSLMYDRLRQALTFASRYRQLIAIMLIDLDRFKEINDTLGHHVGDQLLVEASARLAGAIRKSDTAARMGGDEFLVILPDVGSATNAAHLAQKFNSLLASPFLLSGHDLYISASIGVTMFPNDGSDPDVLVKNADTAMYHAKAQGKNNFKFFTEDINKSTVERFVLETRFRQALDKLEFHLNYQPKIDIKTGRIIGMEALLRWYHPDQGQVRPTLFIPLAEETGLIIPLGEWALREACRQNKEWQDEGLRPIRVSVNLSVRQFRKRDFLTIVKEILSETGLDPKYLMLEITESTIIEDISGTIIMLNALRDAGVSVSIDDFGTGYSSLNYLNKFALDELKIDASFISDLSIPENCRVVESIIALAHGLKHKVVAEGVETRDQVEFLRSNDCDEIQGYYFSKPLSAETLHDLLKKDPVFET